MRTRVRGWSGRASLGTCRNTRLSSALVQQAPCQMNVACVQLNPGRGSEPPTRPAT
jgi:hypothetical protein